MARKIMFGKNKLWLIALMVTVLWGSFGCAAKAAGVDAKAQPASASVNGSGRQQGASAVSQRLSRLESLIKEQGKIRQAVDGCLAQYEGDYSVYFYDLRTGAEYTANEKVMPSASMIKMFILGKAYQEMAAGKLSESESIVLKDRDIVGGSGNIQWLNPGTQLSVKYLLRHMIIESDNVATNLLIDRLGMENLNRYMVQQGYQHSKLQRKMMDYEAREQGRENYTTVTDLGVIFRRLYTHQCVNSEADEKMLATLKDQTEDDRILAGLPAGTVVAHKTGDLEGIYNDGGIVYGPRGAYVLVVLSDQADAHASENIAEISRAIYGCL